MLYETATLDGAVRFTEFGLATIGVAVSEMTRGELLELLGIVCGGAEFNVEVIPHMNNMLMDLTQRSIDRADLDSIITTEDV